MTRLDRLFHVLGWIAALLCLAPPARSAPTPAAVGQETRAVFGRIVLEPEGKIRLTSVNAAGDLVGGVTVRVELVLNDATERNEGALGSRHALGNIDLELSMPVFADRKSPKFGEVLAGAKNGLVLEVLRLEEEGIDLANLPEGARVLKVRPFHSSHPVLKKFLEDVRDGTATVANNMEARVSVSEGANVVQKIAVLSKGDAKPRVSVLPDAVKAAVELAAKDVTEVRDGFDGLREVDSAVSALRGALAGAGRDYRVLRAIVFGAEVLYANLNLAHSRAKVVFDTGLETARRDAEKESKRFDALSHGVEARTRLGTLLRQIRAVVRLRDQAKLHSCEDFLL